MKFEEVIGPAIEALESANGWFQTAYQICFRIQERHPALWARMVQAYPSLPGENPMGAGAGRHYSPASFVAHALEYHRKDNDNLRKEYLTCEGVTFSGIEPGYTGNVVSIWSIRNQ